MSLLAYLHITYCTCCYLYFWLCLINDDDDEGPLISHVYYYYYYYKRHQSTVTVKQKLPEQDGIHMYRFEHGMRTHRGLHCSCAVTGSLVHNERTSVWTTHTTARQCHLNSLCPMLSFTSQLKVTSRRCSANLQELGTSCMLHFCHLFHK